MSQWTQADVDRIAQRGKVAAKPSKYRNVKVEVDGQKFDSKKEAAYWLELKARQHAGEIINLQRQISFDLYCPDRVHTYKGESPLMVVASYVADFTFNDMEDGRLHVIDVKGQKKRACPYPLKAKWLELQEHIVIEEV